MNIPIENLKTSSWYRGEHHSFYPYPAEDYIGLTKQEIIEKFILEGWVPDKPFLTKQDKITVFGSCFAQSLLNFLQENGYASPSKYNNNYIAKYSGGMTSTFTVRQQFEWVYEDKRFPEDVWFHKSNIVSEATEEVKLDTKNLLDETNIFIITLGISELWYHKITGDVFWKAIPGPVFDKEKHGFRVTTVRENIDNLNKVLSIIENNNSNATVVLTLSPVTLVTTFRPISCITANSVSKSILRVAIDEVIRNYKGQIKLFYWPSYEIVNEFFPDSYQEDRRHITKETVSLIMNTFLKYFYIIGD